MLFPVVFYEKGVKIPDGICYIVAQGGVYLKKDTGLITATVKVDSLSFLEELEASAEIKIPPLPLEIFVQAKLFFSAVYKEHRSESVVLLYFNEETKEYRLAAPNQTVSSAHLNYKPDFSEAGFKLVGSIHSHADFSAFHSGTDHRDESNFDGLHITIGHVNGKNFSISTEVAVNNNRFKQKSEDWILELIEAEDVIDVPLIGKVAFGGPRSEETKETVVPKEVVESKETVAPKEFVAAAPAVEKKKPYFRKSENVMRFPGWRDSVKKYNLIFPEGQDWESYSFPPEWLDKVKAPVYTLPDKDDDYYSDYFGDGMDFNPNIWYQRGSGSRQRPSEDNEKFNRIK
jgi:PRTRC genetic system protein A